MKQWRKYILEKELFRMLSIMFSQSFFWCNIGRYDYDMEAQKVLIFYRILGWKWDTERVDSMYQLAFHQSPDRPSSTFPHFSSFPEFHRKWLYKIMIIWGRRWFYLWTILLKVLLNYVTIFLFSILYQKFKQNCICS